MNMFWEVRDRVPMFYNLTDLEVTLVYTAYCTDNLMAFLEKTPKLELLKFEEGIASDSYHSRTKLTSENVPSCFSSCLKVLIFSSFLAKPTEMELLGFVLKYAIVLKRMTINYSCDLEEDKEKEARDQLNMLPIASENRVIELLSFED